MEDDMGGLEVEDPNQPGSFIVRFPACSGYNLHRSTDCL